MVAKQACEHMERRENITELIQSSRIVSSRVATRAIFQKMSPKQKASIDKTMVDSVAAVIQAASTIEGDVVAGRPGSPGDPGKTFDDIFDWKNYEDGEPYWEKGLASFDEYLQTVCLGPDPRELQHGLH